LAGRAGDIGLSHHKRERGQLRSIKPRLAHFLRFMTETGRVEITCDQVDDALIETFRAWSSKQPVYLGNDKTPRQRALGSTEGTVRQLAAAINAAHHRQETLFGAKFRGKATQGREHHAGLSLHGARAGGDVHLLPAPYAAEGRDLDTKDGGPPSALARLTVALYRSALRPGVGRMPRMIFQPIRSVVNGLRMRGLFA
jgi:hypothetical protein